MSTWKKELLLLVFDSVSISLWLIIPSYQDMYNKVEWHLLSLDILSNEFDIHSRIYNKREKCPIVADCCLVNCICIHYNYSYNISTYLQRFLQEFLLVETSCCCSLRLTEAAQCVTHCSLVCPSRRHSTRDSSLSYYNKSLASLNQTRQNKKTKKQTHNFLGCVLWHFTDGEVFSGTCFGVYSTQSHYSTVTWKLLLSAVGRFV
jgi:hypothetical protein